MSTEFLQSQPQVPAQRDSALGFKGLFEVFVNPSGFFTKLKNDPKILVPYLVGFALMLTIVVLLWSLIAQAQIDEMKRQAIDNPNIPANLEPATMKWWIIGGGTFMWALGPLIAAVLALLFGNFVMAGKATFGQLLSIMLYGEIIYLVGGLLAAPLMLYKGTMYISLSLAALVPPDPQSFVWVLLSKVNLFLIWEIIAVGIGLSIFYGFPRNKGYLLSVLSMGMISILQVLFAAF